MAGFDSDEALVGVTGNVVKAPLGTTVPADLEPWGAGWVDLGYVSEDGLNEDLDEDSTEIPAWQIVGPLRVETTKSTWKFGFTLLQTNFDTVASYYKATRDDFTAGAVGTGAVILDSKGKPRRIREMWGFDVVDGDELYRAVFPLGELTARGARTHKSDTVSAYQMTVTGYPGSDGISCRRIWNSIELPAAA